MYRFVWSVAFALLFSVGALHAADAAPAGTWQVDVKPSPNNKLKGTDQGYPDVITIKDGKLSTQVSSKYGYPNGACQVKNEGGKTIVLAELKSDKHGTNTYTLEVTKTGISGTMKWGKVGEDGKTKSAEYTISSK